MNTAGQLAATLLAVLLLAVVNYQHGRVTLNYVAAYQPQFGGGFPYSGNMHLTFNNGIISGWYSDTSIKPGAPFSNQARVAVSGGVNGNKIHFNIGSFRTLWINGAIDQYGSISGSGTYRGRIYRFQAKVRH